MGLSAWRAILALIASLLATASCERQQPALWEAYLAVAGADVEAGRLARAEELLLDAIDTAPREQWIHLARAFRRLGHRHYFKKAYEDAIRNYERALRMTEKASPGRWDRSTMIHLELAQAYKGKGNLERAEALMRMSLSGEEQHLREGEASVVKRLFRSREQREQDEEALRTVIGNLAGLLAERGQYAEAEQLYLRELSIMKEGMNRHHLYGTWIAYPLASLGELYRKQGRHKEAEERFKEALQVMEQRNLNNSTVTVTMENYAALLRDLGREDEARRIEEVAKARRATSKERSDSSGP